MDTQAYMDSVAKKKGNRKKKVSAPTVQSLKATNRSNKRRINKLEKQNEHLRQTVSICMPDTCMYPLRLYDQSSPELKLLYTVCR